MSRRWQTAGITLVLALLVFLPIVVIATFDKTELPSRLETQPAASTGQVDVTEVRASGSAQLTVDWSTPVVLIAPGWDGLVTEVHVEPGDSLTTGSPVATVDGVRRLAVEAPSPWFRVLQSGSTGSDVASLQDALSQLGYLDNGRVASSGTWDDATGEAVRQLADDLGAEASDDGPAFDPAWFVWLSAEAVGDTVDSVGIAVGTPAPPVGEALATSEPVATAAAVQSSLLDLEGQTTWMLDFEEGEVFDAVAAFDSGIASPQTLVELETVLAPPADADRSEVAVQLVEPSGMLVARVAPSAWVRSTDGDGCVWTRATTAEQWRAEPFSGYNSDLGVGVTDDERVIEALGGNEILLNADDVLEDATCP